MNHASIIDPHPADAVALISRREETGYGTLRDQVARLRGGLTGLGVEPGDRVAIVASNNWYFVVSYLATLGVGAVAVPLNPQAPAAAVASELRAVGAVAVVIGPAARACCAEIPAGDIPELRHRIGAGFEPEGGVALDDLMAGDPAPMVDRDDDDLAVLCFTSGTAGRPRAAMLTHGNLSVNLRQVAASSEEGPRPDDVVFGLLPHVPHLRAQRRAGHVAGGRRGAAAGGAVRPRVGPRGHPEARRHHHLRPTDHVGGVRRAGGDRRRQLLLGPAGLVRCGQAGSPRWPTPWPRSSACTWSRATA